MAGIKKKKPLVTEEKIPKSKAKAIPKPDKKVKSIGGWGITPSIAVFLLVALSAAVIEFIFVKAVESDIHDSETRQASALVQQDVGGIAKDRLAMAGRIAKDQNLISSLSSTPEISVKAIEASAPDLVGVYLVDDSKIGLVRQSHPELGFASVDALRKATTTPKIDAYVENKQWFYQVSVATEGTIDRKLLLIFNVSKIEQMISKHASTLNSSIAVHTESKANAVKVMENGGSVRSGYVALPVGIGQWELRFALNEGAVPSIDRAMLWVILGAVALLSFVFVFVLSLGFAKKVKGDVILASSLIQSALDGQRKKTDRLVFEESIELVNFVNKHQKEAEALELSNAHKLASAASVAQNPDAMAVQEAPAAGEDDDLNFDDLDLDEELGLSEELTEAAPQNSAAVPSLQSVDVDASIFRAYDIRGIVDETLTELSVEAIGRAFASEAMSQGQKTVCVGYDGRLSSPDYCEAICRGVTSAGADVIVVGQVPTPVLYFATHQLQTGTGIMITGSHNPSNYNGFKMMIGGRTLAGDDIQGLYQRIVGGNFTVGDGVRSDQNVDEDYLDAIVNDVAVAAPLKVVLDAGNGVAGELAPRLVEELGCEVIPLFCEIDGTFPNHHPDPGKPKNLQDLINAVKEHDADIGLAFDGDGDRVGVVTNSGKIIWPDRLLMLFAKDVVSRNPGADIIYDVKCSRHLNNLISSYGGRPIMWKTGHSLIKAKMKETGALLAGEMSGHVFFKERWYGFDDGLYSAVRLLEILGIEGRTADDVFRDFPEDVSTPEINVDVTDEVKFQIVEKLCELKATFTDANVSTIDGLRADYADGWGLCRASNTTPVLVLRFEADNEEALERIKEQFKTQLLVVDSRLNVDF